MTAAAADRLDFAPPQQPGAVRALGIAVGAHVLLLAALTWGVQWRHQSQTLSVDAELWASVPQAAAPKAVTAPPAPPPPLVAPPPAPANAAIAVEREKPAPPKPEPKAEKPDKPAPPEKPRPDPKAEAKRKAEAEASQLEAQRKENLERMAGLAGASGGPSATGSALQSAGPSASYAGRVRALIKRNIVFSEDLSGNPAAEIEVRAAPDGTIIGRKLVKSSGNKPWDDAVLKAIDKAEVLPRDTDGRVPSSLLIVSRPRD